MLLLIGLAIGVGIGCGLAIVCLISWQRSDLAINSLVNLERIVGQTGIVETPFDSLKQGKIHVDYHGMILKLRTFTDDQQGFVPGDRVVVMAAKGNHIWVVSEQSFRG